MISSAKREVALQQWEDENFPILCKSCLGDESVTKIRMIKERFGSECKVCLRPFTTFRWTLACTKSRFKKTLICFSCCKSKGVCQCCILDLQWGLPVLVRDKILGIEDDVPEQEANRAFYFHNRNPADRDLAINFSVGKNGSAGREALNIIAAAYSKELSQDLAQYRNMPFVCSFFLKGTCNRGTLCPYSHDALAEAESNRTKIMNRYFGRKDAVAEKIMANLKELHLPPALFDKSITSIALHDLDRQVVGESELREKFAGFGDIGSVVIVREQRIGFVNFLKRDAADSAVGAFLDAPIEVNGCKMRVTWAFSKAKGLERDYSQPSLESKRPELQNALKLEEAEPSTAGNSSASTIKYSSMQRNQLGAAPPKRRFISKH